MLGNILLLIIAEVLIPLSLAAQPPVVSSFQETSLPAAMVKPLRSAYMNADSDLEHPVIAGGFFLRGEIVYMQINRSMVKLYCIKGLNCGSWGHAIFYNSAYRVHLRVPKRYRKPAQLHILDKKDGSQSVLRLQNVVWLFGHGNPKF